MASPGQPSIFWICLASRRAYIARFTLLMPVLQGRTGGRCERTGILRNFRHQKEAAVAPFGHSHDATAGAPVRRARAQAVRRGHEVRMFGDDTWVSLFPPARWFADAAPFPSLNVKVCILYYIILYYIILYYIILYYTIHCFVLYTDSPTSRPAHR